MISIIHAKSDNKLCLIGLSLDFKLSFQSQLFSINFHLVNRNLKADVAGYVGMGHISWRDIDVKIHLLSEHSFQEVLILWTLRLTYVNHVMQFVSINFEYMVVCFNIVLWVVLFCLGHAIGRQAFLTHGVISPLSKLFDDPEDVVRKYTHLAIEMASECTMGTCLYWNFNNILNLNDFRWYEK